MRALDRKLFRDLGQMKGQVGTIALVVACGVAVFVAALSTYDSLRWSQQHYYETARFAQVYTSLKRAPASLGRRIREIAGIAEVETRLVYDVTLDVAGLTAPAVGRLIGIPENGQPTLNRLYVRRGRLLEAGHANEVIISEGFATANQLGPGDQVGAILNGRREILAIVGVALSPEYVFALRGGEPLPDDRQFGVFWISHTALAAAFNMEGAFNDVVLTLAPYTSEQPVTDALDRLLEPYGGLGAYGREQQISHRFVSDEIKQQGVMASTMPPIFLLVAVFLLHVVLGRIVTSQREQIAALKALGYDHWSVGWHYLKMVGLIVLLGSVVGVALGAWLGKLMTGNYVKFFHFPVLKFRLQPWVPLFAGGLGLMSAIVAALSAVRRVVALAPAEAMRPPAPLRYRRTWIEHLVHFQETFWGKEAKTQRDSPLRRGTACRAPTSALPKRYAAIALGLMPQLSSRGRMVLRNLARRPGRALLTTLGIALALPILVLALFWQDAIDYMIAVQFSAIERGDVTVTFTEPVSTRAYREIAHLPGVLQAEGLRAVPVRLRAGHHSYRTAMLGLPEGASLRRLLDTNLRMVPLPSDGLVLTDRLGERLGLQPGDQVSLEVLEGTRVRRDLVVVNFVNDIFGMSAYMGLSALNRLLSEGEVISAVSLSIEQSRTDELYAQLKQLPKVATVSVKQATLKSFEETTVKFILVFTGIMMAFAIAIAVGVVYNNARIALAERARELASLRVLGFTRAEVSTILLTELALELLTAVPLGLWLGYWFVVALVTQTQTELFRIPAVVEPRSYALAALVIMGAGAVSGLIVRHRIDQLDLVGVLKTKE